MKIKYWIGIALMTASLTGCLSSTRPDGFCALSFNGACLSKWENGEKVGSGSIDMRYNGITCENGVNISLCSGSTTVVVEEW